MTQKFNVSSEYEQNLQKEFEIKFKQLQIQQTLQQKLQYESYLKEFLQTFEKEKNKIK